MAGVFAAVLSLALVGMAPAPALAPVSGPLTTTVSGACSGGPGRLSVTTHPPANREYRVEITARGFVDGTRWRGVVADAQSKIFRRVAVDGGWTVDLMLPNPPPSDDEGNDVDPVVRAWERGNRSHECEIWITPAPREGAATWGETLCNSRTRYITLSARKLENGSTRVSGYVDGPPDAKWHLKMAATGASSRQVVEFELRANRGGNVQASATFTGVEDPRLRFVAANEDRGRCFVGLDPANTT